MQKAVCASCSELLLCVLCALLLRGFVQLYDVIAFAKSATPRTKRQLLLPVVLAAMLLAALLLVGEAFRPPTPRKRSLRLSARPQPKQQRWSDRRTNQAVVSKWRRSPEPEVVYEVDRKCVAKHLPRGADAAYLRDVLSDAFGPLASAPRGRCFATHLRSTS